MSKRNSRKNDRKKSIKDVNSNSPSISEERMIEIQAEAYYRALIRLEKEKEKKEENKQVNKKKDKGHITALFVLNVLGFPWKINKHFKMNNKVYDSVLVLFVSFILQIIGSVIWLVGAFAIGGEIVNFVQGNLNKEWAIIFLLGLVFLFFGSTLILAGNEFSKESDSNRVYAYSASILALISCIVGIIALFKGAV